MLHNRNNTMHTACLVVLLILTQTRNVIIALHRKDNNFICVFLSKIHSNKAQIMIIDNIPINQQTEWKKDTNIYSPV